MVTRWVFYDPATLTSETFIINAAEGGTPSYTKTINYTNTAAPDGKTLVFEGRDQVQRIEFSGTLLTQAHFEMLQRWWEKRNQIRLTDDLARQFWIVIESFEPKRVRSAVNPWKHEYNIKATIVDWPT
jgi:hypothetical protein